MASGNGRQGTLLVLDFDGVICDSVDECLVSSWIAYYQLFLREQPPEVPVSLRAEFARLRPFIRSGEDFLLIQSILKNGIPIPDQEAFDSAARAAGTDTMARYRELFDAARSDLLERDRPFWLSLNRVYPHVQSAFGRLPSEAPVHILSTKRPRYIRETLDAARIRFPADRIHLAPKEAKLPAVEELRAAGAYGKAVFIDDQLDYVAGNTNPLITAYLASWGYVKKEWLAPGSGVPVIGPRELVELVEREYREG
jgi:phosphoglycolate phosphatase-like HAD superfamily hydrolase